MKSKYISSDVSVIIPTYNRVLDLEKTLEALIPFANDICQIIIVDQSNNGETERLVKNLYKKHRNVKYIFSKVPSISIARNLGVKHLSKKAKIICFIDDDVSLGDNYFKEILRVFNEHPEARGVAGYVPSPELSLVSPVERGLRMFFRISYGEINRARIISAYGNTYPYKLTKIINSHWMPGVNMNYTRDVFKEQQFDENLLGYTVAEDIDFSYRLYIEYGASIFITPFASLIHRVSKVERAPTPRMSYINQADHFYFQFKNMLGMKQRMVFGWSLLGILILRTIKALMTRKKEDSLKFKYFLVSLGYCLRNIGKIQKGRVREFLQE